MVIVIVFYCVYLWIENNDNDCVNLSLYCVSCCNAIENYSFFVLIQKVDLLIIMKENEMFKQ